MLVISSRTKSNYEEGLGAQIEARRDSRTTACVFGLFTNQIMLRDRLAFRRDKHSLWDAKLSFALGKSINGFKMTAMQDAINCQAASQLSHFCLHVLRAKDSNHQTKCSFYPNHACIHVWPL
jgi:hypothetical protein